MTVGSFLELVKGFSRPAVFNPYSDTCAEADLVEAPRIRTENLRLTLEACIHNKVDTVWIARDLGYRGGRRTGIALTDEANLRNLSLSLGQGLPIIRATKGPIVVERTAAVIWRMIGELELPVFTWNVFPFHPHVQNEPLTNRCHTRAERIATRPILLALLDLLKPSRIIAIGNDAKEGLADLGIDCTKVRHPSYGGVSDFEKGMRALHGSSRVYETQPIAPQLF